MCELCDRTVVLGTDLRRLGREISKIERQLAPITREYEDLLRSHPRCASCGILVGQDHSEQKLAPEPSVRLRARGQKRYDVCSSCYDRLFTARRSVAEQRGLDRIVAAELGLVELAAEAL